MSDSPDLRVGLYGTHGHQIFGAVPGLERARLTAVAGMGEGWFAKQQEKQPDLMAGVAEEPDLEGLLAHDDVDLVSLCSPWRSEQASHAVACLEAGKHVLGEKPLATSFEDLERLDETAARTGRRAWAMLPSVYQPCFVAARDLVESGRLGTPVQLYGQKSYRFGASRPQDRRWDGGIVQAAIHAFSFAGHVVGRRFTEVFARDTRTGNPGTGDLQMAMSITARLEGETLASFVANYCNPPGMPYHGNDQLRVHGTAGMLELVDGLNRRSVTIGEEAPTTFEDRAPDRPYPQDLVDAILDERPARLTSEASLHYTRVAVAAQASAERGEPVAIDR